MPSVAASSRWQNFRRSRPLSVQPPISGDPEDPSSWSFAEPKPQIPSLLPNPDANPDATPIPLLPFTVLCLVCFGEFSSAGVAGPFLFFMIDSFGVGGESDVGFWAGITSSVFFFAQFLTSLLWASIADRYGRKMVLLASLLGNAATLCLFGASTNLKMALTVRLAQGLFNGAVGVAKGAIRDLTDPTNEGRAYAILGFAWGFGGIAGPIFGGVLEHPADKFPAIFGGVELFVQYPYLLPCLVGASFTSLGAFLTLFIGPDGGPREGQIRLPDEQAGVERAEVPERMATANGPEQSNASPSRVRDTLHAAADGIDALGRSAGKRLSGYFGEGSHDTAGPTSSQISLERTSRNDLLGLPRTFTQQVEDETGGPPSPLESDDEGTIVTRRSGGRRRNDWDGRYNLGFSQSGSAPSASGFSRTEERRRGILGGGSAYGYEGSRDRRSRLSIVSGARGQGQAPASRVARNQSQGDSRDQRFSMAQSAMGSAYHYAPDFEAVGEDPALAPQPRKLNFAQRFLLANDDAVLSITDLWVAAAINGEDGSYTAPDEEEDMGGDQYDEDGDESGFDATWSHADDEDGDGQDGSLDEDSAAEGEGEDQEETSRFVGSSMTNTQDGGGQQRPYLPPINFARRRAESKDASMLRPRSMRQDSYHQGRVPSLYNNTGIELPLPWVGAEGPLSPGGAPAGKVAATSSSLAVPGASRYDPTLAGIPESQSARNTMGRSAGQTVEAPSSPGPAQPQAQTQPAAPTEKTSTTPSLWSLLPLTIIAHYGLLAFHSATFDQVFMAFLVTPYKSGGLGLTATHFAELISAMAFCQIGFQFYFYPKVGPPQGKFSHLSMMRLGTMLYLPTYTLFPLLRNFLHPETDALVMAGMITFASMRWLANICAFTAVSILMNALTPPNLVPLANGLAQTTSSASRFIGPILGGLVWARGIQGDFEERSWPWNYHLGFWFVGLAGFAGFIHAMFMLKSSVG